MIGVPSLSVIQVGSQGGADTDGQPDLVARDRRGGRVEEHRRLLAGGRGDGDRVGAEHGLGGEGGNHCQAGAGEADADHVLLGGPHGVVADGAEVPAVAHGHDADADAARLVDGQPHRPRTHDDAEPPLGVDDGRARCLAQHPPARTRIELAGLVVAHVGPQHVGDAVRLHAAQVCHDQHVGSVGGVLGGDAKLLKDVADGLPQCRLPDQHLVLLGHLEAIQDHARPPPSGIDGGADDTPGRAALTRRATERAARYTGHPMGPDAALRVTDALARD
jgi:hypothetical protein